MDMDKLLKAIRFVNDMGSGTRVVYDTPSEVGPVVVTVYWMHKGLGVVVLNYNGNLNVELTQTASFVLEKELCRRTDGDTL